VIHRCVFKALYNANPKLSFEDRSDEESSFSGGTEISFDLGRDGLCSLWSLRMTAKGIKIHIPMHGCIN